jgi:hypothetical protein
MLNKIDPDIQQISLREVLFTKNFVFS